MMANKWVQALICFGVCIGLFLGFWLSMFFGPLGPLLTSAFSGPLVLWMLARARGTR